MPDPAVDFSWWDWPFHPEVVVGLLLLEVVYLLGVGPWRRRWDLAPSVKRSQVVVFSSGVLLLYLTLVSPLHELADHYLFSAHMVQHLVLMLVVPPLLIWGTPPWLLRPLVRPRWVLTASRFLTHPVVAFGLFTTVLAVWHLPVLFNLAMGNELVHHSQHLTFLVASVIMWWPVMSPLQEVPRAGYLVQMVYLFALTLPSNFVGAAIAMSDRVLYSSYDTPARLWGISALDDQGNGGLIMQVPCGLFFLGVLTGVFFVWFNRAERGAADSSEAGAREPSPGQEAASRPSAGS